MAGDTISAYDYVLEPAIPDKGRILTQLSLWWFEQLADVVPNHVISPAPPDGAPRRRGGRGRSSRPAARHGPGGVRGTWLPRRRRAGRLPSRWSHWRRRTTRRPHRRREASGTDLHADDQGATGRARRVDDLPGGRAEAAPGAGRIREITLEIYRRGAELAAERGIILADTKVELGWAADGTLTLGDELLTPDSSRFWPADRWRPGTPQPSSTSSTSATGYLALGLGPGRPPPPLPGDVVEATERNMSRPTSGSPATPSPDPPPRSRILGTSGALKRRDHGISARAVDSAVACSRCAAGCRGAQLPAVPSSCSHRPDDPCRCARCRSRRPSAPPAGAAAVVAGHVPAPVHGRRRRGAGGSGAHDVSHRVRGEPPHGGGGVGHRDPPRRPHRPTCRRHRPDRLGRPASRSDRRDPPTRARAPTSAPSGTPSR